MQLFCAMTLCIRVGMRFIDQGLRDLRVEDVSVRGIVWLHGHLHPECSEEGLDCLLNTAIALSWVVC